MNIQFDKPVFKKTYYLSRTDTPICYDLIDVTIKKAQKLKDKGFILTLNISQNDQEFFRTVDDTGIYSLLTNNYNWFSNDLSEDDIKSMYIPSLCVQNNAINIYIKSDASYTCKLNNKIASIEEFIRIISDLSYTKKYTINMQVYHTGLYIYSGQTMHKWGLKTLNIYTIEDNILNDDDLEDIENSWGELVNRCDNILLQRITDCENTRSSIKKMYSRILQEKKSNKDWESKIMELNKMIQNII